MSQIRPEDIGIHSNVTVTGQAILDIDANKSDTQNLPKLVRAIECRPGGTGGNVRVIYLDGTEGTFAIEAGEMRMVGASKVFNTDTTAVGLEGIC